MRDLFIGVLSSATVSTALAAILVWISREWISARLKASIQHEYSEKLETLKAQLIARHEVAILNIRTTFEREAAVQSAAHRSFAEGQKAAMERRLEAVDRLWGRILHLRGNLSPLVAMIDVMTVDEYKRAKEHPDFRALVGDSSLQKLGSILAQGEEQAEGARPYVGEYVWSLFFCYEAILIRLMTVVSITSDDAAKIEWYKNATTRQFITAALRPNELEEFDQLRFGRIPWLQRAFESKILAAIQNIVSGEKFGTESLEQAHALQQLAARAETDERRARATSSSTT